MSALQFDRHPREHSDAYEAFLCFRDLGQGRSLAAVQRRTGRNRSTLHKWSAKFQWTARVAAYTAHLARVELAAREQALRQQVADWRQRQTVLREEEWILHDDCIRAGRAALERFASQDNVVTLSEIARILELASKLGRLASGLATDKTELSGDGGVIRVEFAQALKKVYGVTTSPVTGEPAPNISPVLDVEEIKPAEVTDAG